MSSSQKLFVLFLILFAVAICSNGMSDASALPGGQAANMHSGITLISLDSEHFSINYATPKIQSIDRVENQIRFTRIQTGEMSVLGEEGAPGIPFFGLFFAIPEGAQLEIIVERGSSHRYENITLMPVQPPVPDTVGVPTPPFAYDAHAYEKDVTLPDFDYLLEDEKRLRGLRVNQVWVSPVSYNPKKQTLEIFDEINVTVNFLRSKKHFFSDQIYRSKNFDSLYKKLLINSSAIKNTCRDETKSPNKEQGGSTFLILSHPNFIKSANALRDWKLQKGIPTEVIDIQKIGSTGEEIFNFIQNAYFSNQQPVQYVLLVGDAEFIPTLYKSFHLSHFSMMGSDHHYACVDGEDIFPDIGVGRIPVDTPEEAEDRIQKIIRYESDPIRDEDFYNTTWHFAYFQDDGRDGKADRRFSLTSEEMFQWFSRIAPEPAPIPNRCYTTNPKVNPVKWSTIGNYNFFADWWDLPKDWIPYELTREAGFPWDCDHVDITQAVNDGTFFITHRDHGATQKWGDPGYSTSNVFALKNDDKLPVVFSVNCQTGWFDNETDSILTFSPSGQMSFAESWMRNFNGGAVGVLAATRISYSGFNDRLVWGWMDALWPGYIPRYSDNPEDELTEDVPAMSDVLNYGKIYLASIYTPSDSRKIAIEEFVWFGDPTMKMWTREPIEFYVSHPEAIPYSAKTLTVEVKQDAATVVLMVDNKVIDVRESSNGKVEFPIDLDSGKPLTIYLSITKDNHRPYFGTVQAVSCALDEDCSDNVFCNGPEACVNYECEAGEPPVCDDGLFCTGAEICDEKLDACISLGDPCEKGYVCNEEITACQKPDPFDEDTTGDVCGF